MARYYILFDTMKLMAELSPQATLSDLLAALCRAKEFDEYRLRVNEKRTLNALNTAKGSALRFPFKGKIKSTEMKISVLIQVPALWLQVSELMYSFRLAQAALGGDKIDDWSLNQDISRLLPASTAHCGMCGAVHAVASLVRSHLRHYRAVRLLLTNVYCHVCSC